MEEDKFRRLIRKVGIKKQLLLEKFQEASHRGIAISEKPIETRCQSESKFNCHYGIVPCFETLLDVPMHIRKQHFLESLREYHVILGTVVDYVGPGVRIRIEAVDNGPARDLTDLKIDCVCAVREWPLYYGREKLDQFQRGDCVRAVVIRLPPKVRIPSEPHFFQQLEVSMRVENLPARFANLRLGLTDKQELPAHAKSVLYYRSLPKNYVFDFNKFLESQSGFRNPAACEQLLERTCDDSSACRRTVSLLDDLNRCILPAGETAESLRKQQNSSYALQFVETGVGHYRGGRFAEAMGCYLRALEADPDCVEAFVARGALYTVTESFEIAIENFDEALRRDATNANARAYLIKTLILFGNKKCQDVTEKNIKEAKELYERALKTDGQSEEAIKALERIAQLEVQLLADAVRKRGDAKHKKGSTISIAPSERTRPKEDVHYSDSDDGDGAINCYTVPAVRSAISVLEKLVDQDHDSSTKPKEKAHSSRHHSATDREHDRSRSSGPSHSHSRTPSNSHSRKKRRKSRDTSKKRRSSGDRDSEEMDSRKRKHGDTSLGDSHLEPDHQSRLDRNVEENEQRRPDAKMKADTREKLAEYQQFVRMLKQRQASKQQHADVRAERSVSTRTDTKTYNRHAQQSTVSKHAKHDSGSDDDDLEQTLTSSHKLSSCVVLPKRDR